MDTFHAVMDVVRDINDHPVSGLLKSVFAIYGAICFGMWVRRMFDPE